MPPPLQVTVDGLHALAQRCSTLAGQIAPTLPAVTASGWQATAAATNTAYTGARTTAAALRARMSANAGKLTKAALDYAATDGDGGTALTSASSHIPAGAGADGGAGSLPAAPPVPLAPDAGADGGAGGLGRRR